MFSATKSAHSAAAAATDPYFMYVTALLNGDGTNGAQNNTFLNTPPGGVGSYSGSFNGSTQYLSAPNNSAFDFGTGDFTIEGWFYKSAQVGSVDTVITYGWTSTATGPFVILYNGSNQLQFYASANGSSWDIANGVSMGTFTTGQWVHFAVSRQGSSIRLFLNGTLNNTVTSSASLYVQATYPLTVGGNGNGGNKMNGYISNIRLVKGTAVYTTSFTPPTSPLTAISGTQLLTCQSATFVDNSANNFTITNNGSATIVNPNTLPTITRNGTPTQGSFSPYGTLWGNYFNGTDSTLRYTSSGSAVNFTGAYTIECFFYLSSNLTYIGLFSAYAAYLLSAGANGATGGITLGIYSSGSGTSVPSVLGLATYGSASPSSLSATGLSIPLNTWHHVVVVRDSSNVTSIYLNGVRVASATISGTYASQVVEVGGDADGTNYYAWFPGYISNMRVVKGTAVYDPTQTSLNVPTAPLTAITNTSLLTCQSNRFIDNSTNAFAITVNGSPSVQRFSPFEPTTSYTPAVNGGSGYFNGNGDYLSTPATSALALGAGSFTVEAWIYPTRVTNTYSSGICGTYAYVSLADNGWVLSISSTGYLQISLNGTAGSGSFSITSSTITPVNAWSHVAAVRNGTTVSLYLNGVQVATGTSSKNENYTGSNFNVATYRSDNLTPATGNSGTSVAGYVSEVRVVVGTAVYTSAFTPPTAPLTAVTNTSLLLNYTNAGISDAAAANDLTTVGNAQVSTSVVKYGTGSMYFDGTGDYLTLIDSPNLQLMAGDFTIEGWIYLAANGVVYGIVSKGTATTGWSVNVTIGNKLQFSYTLSNLTGATSLSATTWYHFAVVRSGTASGNLKIYLNGVADATSAGAVTDTFNQTNITYVGADRVATSQLNGYIDDLRITKGYARYTANFTPPTAALPTY